VRSRVRSLPFPGIVQNSYALDEDDDNEMRKRRFDGVESRSSLRLPTVAIAINFYFQSITTTFKYTLRSTRVR